MSHDAIRRLWNRIESIHTNEGPMWTASMRADLALAVGLGIPTLFMAWQIVTLDGPLAHGQDWRNLTNAGQLLLSGANPYTEPLFRWNPLIGYAFAAISGAPYWLWIAAHVAVLFALPTPARWIALISWPFWFDVLVGNVMALVFMLAWHALDGKRWAVIGFILAALLIPRPLMLPVLTWLLWKQPWSRWWFVGLALVVGAGTLATGWTAEYLNRLAEIDWRYLVAWGPFYPLMLALAAWLTWKGRLGLASLAASPYLIVNYLLMLVLEVSTRPARSSAPTPRSTNSPTSLSPSR